MTDWFRAPFSKAGRTYLKERAIFKDGTPYGQLGMTYQQCVVPPSPSQSITSLRLMLDFSMPEMERLKAYEHLDTKRFSLLSFRKRWIPTVRAKHVIDTVEEIYIEFHQVQAR